LRNTIRDLIDKLNKKEDTTEEDGESHDDESHDDESHDDEDIDDDFFNDLDDIDDAEALDENPNYILRSVIVEQVVRIRRTN
jgi:hypothetical protein